MPINTTVSTANNTFLNKTYYDKKLLETAKTKLVHAEFGQKRNIPKSGGKTVEYRKFNTFAPSTSNLLLQEGVTPASQALTQSHVEATVEQYGAYVQVSDLLNLTAYDDVIDNSVELLGEQLGTTIDWVARDAMHATTNKQYAGDNVSRIAIDGDCLTVDEIRKAVRTLKKNKARMFTRNGKEHFVCICSPEATYDLQSDPLWQNVSAYSNAEQIYSGEIGRLFGVVFVESTEAKVYRQSVLNKVNANTTSSTQFVLADDPSDEGIAYLSTGGNKIWIGATEYTLAANGSYNAATRTVKLTASASLTANAIVYTKDAGALDATSYAAGDIHSTLVFGADAYGVIDIDGSGTMQTIIKQLGEGGDDPLNQRATIAAKVCAYAAVLLQPDWMVAIEHAVS